MSNEDEDDINELYEFAQTKLMCALRTGDLDEAQRLLALGADVNRGGENEWNNPEVDKTDIEGSGTALELAAELTDEKPDNSGRKLPKGTVLALVKQLVKKGAKLEIVADDLTTQWRFFNDNEGDQNAGMYLQLCQIDQDIRKLKNHQDEDRIPFIFEQLISGAGDIHMRLAQNKQALDLKQNTVEFPHSIRSKADLFRDIVHFAAADDEDQLRKAIKKWPETGLAEEFYRYAMRNTDRSVTAASLQRRVPPHFKWIERNIQKKWASTNAERSRA